MNDDDEMSRSAVAKVTLLATGKVRNRRSEQYSSNVYRHFPNVLSSVSEHDIVSQPTALQKELYSCDLSDAFPVQLSSTMHGLQLS